MKLRLLPILIVVAGLALTLRAGDLWNGITELTEARPANAANNITVPNEAWNAVPAAGAAGDEVLETAAGQGDADPAASDMPAEGDDAAAAMEEEPPFDPLSLTDEEIDVLHALAERRASLERRAQDIQYREAMLEAAERRIEEKVDGLKALQQSIESLLQQHEDQTESQYQSLVKIYENMKPKDAARIFEELEMTVLLPVVERMKERKTAPILAKMNPNKAKSITTELAQRRLLTEKK